MKKSYTEYFLSWLPLAGETLLKTKGGAGRLQPLPDENKRDRSVASLNILSAATGYECYAFQSVTSDSRTLQWR